MAEPEKEKKKLSAGIVWREARELIAAHRNRLLLGLVLMLVNRIAGLAIPASSKFLIDDIIGKNHPDWLWPVALGVGIATLFQAVTGYFLAQILGIAGQYEITKLRKSVQAHVARLPVSYFDSTQTGVLISRIMTDAEGIRNLVGTGIVELTGGAFTAMIALCVLFYLNWQLTLIMLVVLGAFGGCMAFAFMKLRPIFRERGKINAEVTGRLTESLGGIRVVKAYTAEPREEQVFGGGVEKLFSNVKRSMTGVSMLGAASTLIIGIIAIVMLVFGGRAIQTHEMSLGEFIMFIFFVGSVVMPVVQMAAIGTQITEAFAGLDRIREIRSKLTEDAEDANRAALPELRGDVAFDQVWFEYNADKPVLKGVSFTAAAGTTTALVGSSGSGKSTLISLILTFNRPLKGAVRVDDKDLTSLKLRDYRAHLGVVFQDNFLFDGTIAENIAFSRPNASLDEIKAAAKVAHCDEFIIEFEKGYDSVVGERGVRLSGGQRQRIAIARALLANPRILILDEATSSLDSESEGMIQEGLQALRRGRTTFVIAHRLSTIRSADQILVLEAGEIVERGTHAELYAQNGRYRQLHDKQYRFEQERFINPGEDFTPEPEKPKGIPRTSNAL